MTIKKLQNNFTTPEQSKRLLELGVPADSADCYYDSWKQVQWRQLSDLHSDFFEVYNHYTPCWSVGRLIEVYCICIGEKYIQLAMRDDMMDSLVYMMEHDVDLDFSKLEE